MRRSRYRTRRLQQPAGTRRRYWTNTPSGTSGPTLADRDQRQQFFNNDLEDRSLLRVGLVRIDLPPRIGRHHQVEGRNADHELAAPPEGHAEVDVIGHPAGTRLMVIFLPAFGHTNGY